MEIISILRDIILPVFIVIGIGCWMNKIFSLDSYTLGKINVYFLIPGFVFINLYKTVISVDLFFNVIVYFLLLTFCLYIVVWLLSYLFSFEKKVRVAFTNSALLFNAGNFGVPLNDLVFKQDPIAMSIQVIIMTAQNILAYSFGIYSLMAVDKSRLKAIFGMLKMPVLYAMITGIALNALHIPLPHFLLKPGELISQAMIGIALFTLGAQIAQLRIHQKLLSIYISLIVRLGLGPLIGYGIIHLLEFDGVLAQVCFIASGLPSSVNSAIIAQEYKNEPDLAAQIVLGSTIFSTITVTLLIYLSSFLF